MHPRVRTHIGGLFSGFLPIGIFLLKTKPGESSIQLPKGCLSACSQGLCVCPSTFHYILYIHTPAQYSDSTIFDTSSNNLPLFVRVALSATIPT
jgi:hypothetical protein